MDQRSCLLLLLFFLVFADLASAICGDFPADPCVTVTSDNCKDCTADATLIPDPFDCHSYYVCSKAVLAFDGKPFTCPDGEIFDISKHPFKCVPGTSCTANCTAPAGGECLYTCGAEPSKDITLADPYDCSIYYKCDAGTAGPPEGCPSTAPFFDGSSCQKEVSHCCHCHPYCYAHEEGALVADPTDCRKYHGCVNEGEPEFSGQCGPNEYFDAHLRECSATAPCVTLCKNVVGSDGCIEPYTCEAEGYFAKCPSRCVHEYYHCKEVSDTYIDPETCSSGFVFDPDSLVCIKNGTCPYE